MCLIGLWSSRRFRKQNELASVSFDAAVTVKIHESKMEGDVMKMSMLSSLPVEPNDNMAFEPGGLHVMLVALGNFSPVLVVGFAKGDKIS